MDKATLIVVALLTFVGLLSYNTGDARDETLLFYTFCMSMLLLFTPKVFELLKEFTQHRGKKAETSEWKTMKERLENLEGLMCRLDTEINYQLEQSLTAGKLTTITNPSDGSQLPTAFLNVASALDSRFQVLKELGRGGMGIIFQAQDKQLNEQVAIKILSPLLSHDPSNLERLKREVSAARRITHPNVIRIHDISELNGLHFVSMEYFHGTNLKDHIRKSRGLSPTEAHVIADQICNGLEAAHRQGVIHRDLKSQNIIVSDTGDIKIIDFGLARTAQLDGMTATGLIMGTPEYMAPEQVAGKKVDERADIYSLGIILYELFTGRVPFTGESAIAVGFRQLKEPPEAPRQINSNISPEMENIILKALQKDALQRYQSVAELRADLEQSVRQAAPKPLAEPARRETGKEKEVR